jgi:FtsH-binding integral membrane protein
MAFSPDYRAYPNQSATTTAVLDAGLRAYMLRVYNWMASGLLLTGIVAFTIAHTGAIDAFFPLVQTVSGRLVRAPTALAYIAMFAPLAFVLVLNFGVNRLSTSAVQALFWAFCAAMGASLTSLFVVYTGASIAEVFFITAATFAATSLYGYTTNADLSRMGSFMMMGLFGIIIASLINMFMQSAALQYAISYIGVVVFVGLTAYDTQRIKADYVQYAYAEGTDLAARRGVYDALSLYLNFINLFMFLLQIMGVRNNN